MSPRHRTPVGARWLAVAGALALVAFVLGYALASTTIASGTESGTGSAENAALLSWFVISQVITASVPSPVPPTASASMGLPTVLLAVNQTFVLAPSAAGHGAVRWDLTEKGAPTKTELTLAFVVTNATTHLTDALTVFIESQATAPSGSPTYSFYFDTGAGMATLTGDSVLSQQCPAVGNCP